MLTAGQIKGLKQTNVSKDAEKTMQRFKEDFTATTSREKKVLEELSGQRRGSFYRVNETGSINARVVLATAQTLNVSPFYYTGEEDEKQPLQEEQIRRFLQQHGYTELDEEAHAKTKRNKKKKEQEEPVIMEVIETEDDQYPEEMQEPEMPEAAVCDGDAAYSEDDGETILVELTLPDSPEMQKAIDELSKEDAIMLLEALYVRGRAGGNSAQFLEFVKRCLLS